MWLSSTLDDSHAQLHTMQLYAQVHGATDAPALLFIAGFVGSHHSWDENFLQLASRFKLVLIDTLGFGRSPRPDIDYSVCDHVTAIADTLSALGIERAHVVGHSMGCLLGLALAKAHPSRVGHLALLAPPLFESEAEARQSIKHVSLFNRWLATDTPLAELACRIMCRLRPLLIPLAPRLVSDVPPMVARDALLHSWHSYSRTLRNVIFRGAGTSWQQAPDHELLLIAGTGDTTAPLRNVQSFLRSHPRAELITLPAKHGLIFTHSATIARVLFDFFTRSTGERSPAARAHLDDHFTST